MSQVTRTSRREQVLLFGINYARGGVACERQLPGSTSSLGGREGEGQVEGCSIRAGGHPHGTGTTWQDSEGALQDKAKAPHLRR